MKSRQNGGSCGSIAEAQQQQLLYSSKNSKPRYFTYSFWALSSTACWNVPLQGQGSGLQLLLQGVHFGAPLPCHPTSAYCGRWVWTGETTRMGLILPRPCHPNKPSGHGLSP